MKDIILQLLDVLIFDLKIVVEIVVDIPVGLEYCEISLIGIITFYPILAVLNLAKHPKVAHQAEFIRKAQVSFYQITIKFRSTRTTKKREG